MNQGELPARIFLLGFMGSGKSTIGPRVAQAIGYAFIDLDASIERRSGRTIASLFNELGESGFRRLETGELKRAATMGNVVVSCGGGIVTVAENREIIRSSGLSVYLKTPPDVLKRRLVGSEERPMLYGRAGGTLEGTSLDSRIDELIAERAPYYESADLVVDLDDESVEQAVATILRAIQGSTKSSN